MASGKLYLLLLAFCLLSAAVSAKKGKKTEEAESSENEGANNETPAVQENAQATEEGVCISRDEAILVKESAESETPEKEEEDESDTKDAAKAFSCNLKYKRVGCYKDKAKKQRPLSTFIMTDEKLGTTQKRGKTISSSDFDKNIPEFACKCANEALTNGNAIFGIQNFAECWTGPDNSKFDSDGASESCVTFGLKPCDKSAEICAGKKHANFVYFVESPEHDKTKEEAEKELAELKKQEEEKKKKEAAKAKAKKGKKGKKVKKHGKKQ